ncbi:transcription initiation factor TFIID component TAF4 family-domain-containing protein [Polychytrium aggregatum]|uniref:transcription initiation factor TFIID component TAF4 family-domain-containing protein n=1 Tax=Polychytrium aggregatum TaxID=110093 RepID=UPI0022FDC9E7|nr:transcription initiation factor TFIID component TAF4 family-domain-containing protein [Polychytrium aggregatum]KAI9199606.1 transcription initiation factor TFIID component TAF4 family-domain-containing protein [Polychytrium aggregatum]
MEEENSILKLLGRVSEDSSSQLSAESSGPLQGSLGISPNASAAANTTLSSFLDVSTINPAASLAGSVSSTPVSTTDNYDFDFGEIIGGETSSADHDGATLPLAASAARPASASTGLGFTTTSSPTSLSSLVQSATIQSFASKLPGDRKTRFSTLLTRSQDQSITSEDFIAQAKEVLTQAEFATLLYSLSSSTSTVPISAASGAVSALSALTPGSYSLGSAGGQVKSVVDSTKKRAAGPVGEGSTPKKFRTEPDVAKKMIASMNASISTTVNAAAAGVGVGSSDMGPPAPLGRPAIAKAGAAAGPSKVKAEVDINQLDVEGMMDATSYGGVDMKMEEEDIMRGIEQKMSVSGGLLQPTGYRTGVDRARQQRFLNIHGLKRVVEAIAKKHSIAKVDEEYLVYLALALQERLKGLIEKTIMAAKHRVGFTYEQFLELDRREQEEEGQFRVEVKRGSDDIRQALVRIEQEERQQEQDARAKFFPASKANGDDSFVPDGDDDAKRAGKKKGRRERDIPESVKAQNINMAAMLAAGGSQKSWMMAASSIPPKPALAPDSTLRIVPKKTPVSEPTPNATASTRSATDASSSMRFGRSMTLKERKRIILRDALFCLETEQTLCKSEIFYKWLADVK